MIKIKMLGTGDVKLVTPNVAHNLIDKKEAEVYTKRKPRKVYRDRGMKSKRVGDLREESRERNYRNRQMRTSG